MGITLYYIKGINAIDTPVFSNISDQKSYFNRHIVNDIETDSFYPPYYRNVIRLEDTDCTFLSRVNYVSLNYQDKDFYYFIDNFEYLTDGTIALHLIMDTVQTYMFNITFNSYNLTRKSIKRWSDYTNYKINRNYIRENLSQSDFILKEYNEYSETLEWYILVCTKEFGQTEGTPTSPYYLDDGGATTVFKEGTNIAMNQGCFIYLIPSLRGTQGLDLVCPQGTISDYPTIITLTQVIKDDPRVVGCYRIPHLSLQYVTVNVVNNRTVITITNSTGLMYLTTYAPSDQPSALSGIVVLKINECFADVMSMTKTLHNINNDFYTANTNTSRPFNSRYVPAMIDSNYMAIEWGERIQTTTIPLELLVTTSFDLRYESDIFTGFRYYDIIESGSSYDVYQTRIGVQTYEGMTLYNNEWKSWIAQNMGTIAESWTMARINNVFSSVMEGMPSDTTNVNASNSSTLSQTKIVGGRGKPRKPRQTSTEAFGTYSSVVSQGEYSLTSAMMSGTMGLINTLSEQRAIRENLKHTPPKVTVASSNTFDDLAKNINRIYSIYYIRDFDKVALAIEKQGYAVNEHYNNTNIFTAHLIRFYYNVVQIGDISFDLNLLASNDIKASIKERLENGLRLWSIIGYLDNIGDYTYDNVELDYLQ